VHVHLHDRERIQFTAAPPWPVASYQDVEDGLDYAVETAWSTDFRSAFAPAGERQQTIISVLPDDTVGYVLDRLDDARRVAVLVLLADGLLRIAPLAPAPEARIVVAAEDDQVLPIHQDSRVDLFLDYLERVRPWYSGWRGWWITAPAH